jgi:hypothetical protein
MVAAESCVLRSLEKPGRGSQTERAGRMLASREVTPFLEALGGDVAAGGFTAPPSAFGRPRGLSSSSRHSESCETERPLPRTWAPLQRPFRELPTSFRLLRTGRLEGSSHGLSGPFSVRGVRSRTRGWDIPSPAPSPLDVSHVLRGFILCSPCHHLQVADTRRVLPFRAFFLPDPRSRLVTGAALLDVSPRETLRPVTRCGVVFRGCIPEGFRCPESGTTRGRPVKVSSGPMLSWSLCSPSWLSRYRSGVGATDPSALRLSRSVEQARRARVLRRLLTGAVAFRTEVRADHLGVWGRLGAVACANSVEGGPRSAPRSILQVSTLTFFYTKKGYIPLFKVLACISPGITRVIHLIKNLFRIDFIYIIKSIITVLMSHTQFNHRS